MDEFSCREVWGDMDKIDELQARVKELEQEKRIAELELQIARLGAEIAAFRARPVVSPLPYWYVWPSYPEYPTITWICGDTTAHADTATISAASSS